MNYLKVPLCLIRLKTDLSHEISCLLDLECRDETFND